jgi:glutamine synthetase
VLIAALRDGIENRIEPGPPLGDGDHRPDPGDARFALLPSTLAEALDALDGDEVVRGALPVDILETFVATKRDEWARSCGAVTDWARDMYLTYLP